MNIPLHVPFEALAAPQRAAVEAWANSHDWGAGRSVWSHDGKALVVRCAAFDRDGRESVEVYCATDLDDPRGWAGY